MAVKVTKGAKGKIGEKVEAPNGKFVHERKAAPDKDARYFTVTKGNKEIRMMQKPGKKPEVQSVLTKKKGAK